MKVFGLSEALVGVGVTPVTPFTWDLTSVDIPGLRANLEFLVEADLSLLYLCGNTGEFNALSLDEWTVTLETALDTIGDQSIVAPGIGHGLTTALEMLRRASDLGAAGVLLMPPHPTFISDEGLRNYYLQLLDATSLPAVLYKRGGWPSDSLLLDLAGAESVIGVKYGDPDVLTFAEVAARSPEVIWTCGVAERWAPFFHLSGAQGFTSGLANFAPSLALELSHALEGGDYQKAMEIRAVCLPFEEIRAQDGSANNVAAVKTAMDARGLAGGRVRPPLRDLDEIITGEVRAIIAGWP